jgi:hypothetical protein
MTDSRRTSDASLHFEDLPRPLPRLLVVSALLALPSFLLAAWATLGVSRPALYTVLPGDVQILVLNVSLFIAFWTVYFLSPARSWTRCQSLRTLLRDQAIRRASSAAADDGRSENRRTQRTLSLITAQAVFIAVAIILIDVLLGVRSTLDASAGSVPLEIQRLLLDVGLFAAVLSFGALLVSFDAVDTSMNEFTSDRVDRLVSYFAGWASRVKYQGLILVYLALVLLLGAVIPLLGAVGAALLPLMGYTYWFIDPEFPLRSLREARWYRGAVIGVNIVLGAMIFVGS